MLKFKAINDHPNHIRNFGFSKPNDLPGSSTKILLICTINFTRK